MPTVDFYFDFQSPWAYLASTRIETLCAGHGASLRWHPVELERVRELCEHQVRAYSPVQLRYLQRDIVRWAQWLEVPIAMPTIVSTTPVLRGCFFARDAGREAAYIHRVFRARWGVGEDLSDEDTLRAVAADCSLDADALVGACAGGGETAQRLEAANRDAAGRDVFGVPMTFVGDEPFWGNDRLDFVERALATPGP